MGAAVCTTFLAASPRFGAAATPPTVCALDDLPTLEARITKAFARIDTNQDGLVTREELIASGAKPKQIQRFDANEFVRARGGVTRDNARKVFQKRCRK